MFINDCNVLLFFVGCAAFRRFKNVFVCWDAFHLKDVCELRRFADVDQLSDCVARSRRLTLTCLKKKFKKLKAVANRKKNVRDSLIVSLALIDFMKRKFKWKQKQVQMKKAQVLIWMKGTRYWSYHYNINKC